MSTRLFHFTETSGPYAVGLKVIEQYDYSRTFGDERARPLQTFIWYPAETCATAAMTVRDYVDLWASETNFKAPQMSALAEEWRAAMTPTLATSMWARRDAPAAAGRFPLIVYAPSFSFVSWENADLCEYWASHGYVVVAGPCLGEKSRDMTKDLAGADAQARDISFLIGYACTLENVQGSSIAVAGFSWGGLSNLFAAARDNRIGALMALDGSLRYWPGLVKQARDVNPREMSISLLYLAQGEITLEEQARHYSAAQLDGPNVLNAWTGGDLILVRMLALTHGEFGSMYQRSEDFWAEFPERQKPGYGREDGIEGYAWIARYTLRFLDAYLKGDNASLDYLKRSPAENGVPAHFMAVSYRASNARERTHAPSADHERCGLAANLLAGRTVSGPVSARMTIDGRDYVNFFGAGYLALSRLPEIRNAVLQALHEGMPFARSVPVGHGTVDPLFDAVERLGAAACGTETSVYFASGYLIGAVGLASLERAFDVVLLDENAHYSLQDAAKIYGRPTFTFAHCDVGSLANVLKRHVRAGERPLLLTDGVFATTGRMPPLANYAAQLATYEGHLLIDESHAFGVVGQSGRGAAEYCGVEPMATSGATLSKAYCAHGALMGCSTETAARVRRASPIGAACAGSPLSAAASAAALAYVAEHPELRTRLRAMADYLRTRLRQIGIEVSDSPAPIVSFRYGSLTDMQALQRRAFDRGVYIYHSTYIGAGPEGIIRCAVFRDHSREDIDVLIDALS